MPAPEGGGCQDAIASGLEWLTGLLIAAPFFERMVTGRTVNVPSLRRPLLFRAP